MGTGYLRDICAPCGGRPDRSLCGSGRPACRRQHQPLELSLWRGRGESTKDDPNWIDFLRGRCEAKGTAVFTAVLFLKMQTDLSLDRRGTNGREKSLENLASFVGFKEGCINQWGWGDVKTIVQGLIQDRGSEVTSLLNCTGAVWRANVAPAEGLKGATFRTILYSSYCTRQSTRSSIPRGRRSDHWCSLTGGIYIICFGLLTGDLEDHDRSESNERVAGAALP